MTLNFVRTTLLMLSFLSGSIALAQTKNPPAKPDATQPIPVSFPNDVTGEPGATVTIPIIVGDLTGRSVSAYSAVFIFDPSVLRYQNFSIAGTISEPLGTPDQNIINDSTVSIGKPGTQILSGAGVFVNLIFDVVGQPGDSSVLDLNGFIFNSGIPFASTKDGLFTVVRAPAPIMTVNPSSLDFGSVFTDTTQQGAFTISNTGNAELVVTAITLTGPDSADFSLQDVTFPLSVPPDSGVDLAVTFAPQTAGDKTAAVQISSNDPNANLVVIALTGTGVDPPTPAIAVAPQAFDFGSRTIGTTRQHAFMVFNNGTAALTVDSLEIRGGDRSDFILVSLDAPFSVVPGDSHVVRVSFRPQTSGAKSASLHISSNDPQTPEISVALTGVGVLGKPVFFNVGDSLNFGSLRVDSTLTETFYVINETADVINVSSTRLIGYDSIHFELVKGMAPFALAAGDSAEIAIRFAPTTPHKKSAIFELVYNNQTTDTLLLFLEATAIGPQIETNVAAVDFGMVLLDSTRSQKIAIKNSGNAGLKILQTAISGPDTAQFSITSDLSGFTIAGEDSAMLTVTFSPKVAGPRAAQLTLLSDDPRNGTVVIPLTGVGVPLLQFSAAILSPQDSATICTDSVPVIIRVESTGGLQPFRTICKVNGYIAVPSGDVFKAIVPLTDGANQLVATCTVMDGMAVVATDADTITVFRTKRPVCNIEIVAPQDSSIVQGDSVRVRAITSIGEGAPPFDIQVQINDVDATLAGQTAEATVALTEGSNTIIATLTATDSCGFETFCSDTVRVNRILPPECLVSIVSPEDSAFVCSDSLNVTVKLVARNLLPGQTISSQINGVAALVHGDSLFTATVPLASGDNPIVASCRIEENGTVILTCTDSISVFFDDIAPVCTFDVSDSVIVGTFFDGESGIAKVTPVEIRNGTLTVEAFTPGTHEVNFRIDFNDPNKGVFFSIDVTDACGNTTNCDPVVFTLSTNSDNRRALLNFPSADRYLQIANNHLTALTLNLNGNTFKLFAEASRAEQETNAYHLPETGQITLDLQPYLLAGENHLQIDYVGPAGAFADILLTNNVARVDFVLDIQALPQRFQLTQNYPNPFNPETRISFDIPENSASEVDVELRVFNLLGRLVRTLLKTSKRPGHYVVRWDGSDMDGNAVASGIYIYRLKAGEFRQTKQMTLIR